MVTWWMGAIAVVVLLWVARGCLATGRAQGWNFAMEAIPIVAQKIVDEQALEPFEQQVAMQLDEAGRIVSKTASNVTPIGNTDR